MEQARALVTFPTNAPPTYYRPFTDIRGDTVLMEYLFQGTAGTDWANQFPISAKLDRRHTRVISDTTKVTNPGNDTGTQKLYNTWVGVNRRISYADEEFGGGDTSNPWAAPSPWSPGNLYIMDIFSQGFQAPPEGKQLPLLHSLLCIGMKPSEDRLVYVHEFAISFQPVSVCTFLVSGVGVAAIY